MNTINNMQIIIGQVLKIGVFISFILVVIGYSGYLIHHGHELIQSQCFINKPNASIPKIPIFSFDSVGFIQFGLYVLVLIQLLRVFLTAWWFALLREWIFVIVSLFILSLLIFTL